jgi:hypothetical protein
MSERPVGEGQETFIRIGVPLIIMGGLFLGIAKFGNKLFPDHGTTLAGTEPAETFQPEIPTLSPTSVNETIVSGVTGGVQIYDYRKVADPENRDRNCVTIDKSGQTITGAVEALGNGKYSNVAVGDIYENSTHILRFTNQDSPSSLDLGQMISSDGSVVVCEDLVIPSP